MKWSILVLTMPGREELLYRLQQCLYPQIEKYPDIEIIVRVSKGETVGENRQALLESAQGEYVCFVDDDDLVSSRYVESIYPLLDGLDYIGFPVTTYRDGTFFAVAYHSLKYPSWNSDQGFPARDISHLNPIKRELALRVPMVGHLDEDHKWAIKMRELKIVKTEHYIPEPMYFYYIRTRKPEMEPRIA